MSEEERHDLTWSNPMAVGNVGLLSFSSHNDEFRRLARSEEMQIRPVPQLRGPVREDMANCKIDEHALASWRLADSLVYGGTPFFGSECLDLDDERKFRNSVKDAIQKAQLFLKQFGCDTCQARNTQSAHRCAVVSAPLRFKRQCLFTKTCYFHSLKRKNLTVMCAVPCQHRKLHDCAQNSTPNKRA